MCSPAPIIPWQKKNLRRCRRSTWRNEWPLSESRFDSKRMRGFFVERRTMQMNVFLSLLHSAVYHARQMKGVGTISETQEYDASLILVRCLGWCWMIPLPKFCADMTQLWHRYDILITSGTCDMMYPVKDGWRASTENDPPVLFFYPRTRSEGGCIMQWSIWARHFESCPRMSPNVTGMSSWCHRWSVLYCILSKVDEGIGEINAPVLFFYPRTRGEGGCVMQWSIHTLLMQRQA